MGKSKLSDRDIEDLLRGLPKVSDKRHPSEIYRLISLNKQKRRLPSWFIPGVASAIVVFLIYILSPQLIGWQDTAEQKSSSSVDLENSTMLEENSRSKQETTNTEFAAEERIEANDTQMNESNTLSIEEPSAVYPDDLKSYQALTIPIPDTDAFMTVPVTVLIEKADEKTWFNQFKETMSKLTEEKWGLAEYFPLDANLSYDQASATITVDVPANHKYGLGSAAETTFTKILTETFPIEKVKKILFKTEGEAGISLGNFGEVTELPTEEQKNRAYFFYFSETNSIPYMIPSVQNFDTILEAYSAMENDQDEIGLKASIPADIKMEISRTEDRSQTLRVVVTDGSKLNDHFLYNLEAMMLTAKSFGFEKIRIEGLEQEQLGPFDLTKDLPLPVGPNKKIIE